MATIQDVLDSIDALNTANAAKASAETAFIAAHEAAEADVTTEAAALAPVLEAYTTARDAARVVHGYSAALIARDQAVNNAEAALFTMRDTMQELADSIGS